MAKRPVPKKLAKKLAHIRADLGMRQTEIVKALNYKASPLRPAQISQHDRSRRLKLTVDHRDFVERWANILGISVPELLGRILLAGIEGEVYCEQVTAVT
jgi:hypothetical protein